METSRDFNGEPPFCAAGCGFYGVREQHDLCSKCYAAFLRDQIAKSAAEAPTRRASDSASEGGAVSLGDLTALVSHLTIDGSTPRLTKKKNRCSACNKRVGLLGFECRCGDVFCGAHRHPEEHDCNIDFKVAARRRMAEENPLSKADKMGLRI